MSKIEYCKTENGKQFVKSEEKGDIIFIHTVYIPALNITSDVRWIEDAKRSPESIQSTQEEFNNALDLVVSKIKEDK